MKRIVALTFSLVAVVGLCSPSNAATIAYWNFNSGSNATSGTFAASTLNVTAGSGTLTVNNVAPANQVVFGGTVSNLLSPDPDGTGRGVALALQGGASNANNGGYLEFALNMSGYTDLQMSYAAQRTSTGFTSNAISYSVDNGPFQPVTTITGLESSFGTTTAVPASIETANFSSFTDINGSSNVRVRLTVDGATAETGNNRFDNVLFEATAVTVPEPASALLLGLAGMAVTGLVRRRR
jgi:hypothetical protein